MLTLALYGLLAVLLIAGIYLLAAWVLPSGEQIAPPVRDEPIWALPPERALAAADVADVRLPVALRGYRFAETDLLLDRLVEELRARDDEIARLRGPATPPHAESGERLAKPESAGGPSPSSRWAPSKPTSLVKSAAPDKPPAAPDPPTPKAEPAVDAVTAAAARSRAEAAAATADPKPEPEPAPVDDVAGPTEPKSEARPAPRPRRPGVRKPQPAPPAEQVEHVDQGGHDG